MARADRRSDLQSGLLFDALVVKHFEAYDGCASVTALIRPHPSSRRQILAETDLIALAVHLGRHEPTNARHVDLVLRRGPAGLWRVCPQPSDGAGPHPSAWGAIRWLGGSSDKVEVRGSCTQGRFATASMSPRSSSSRTSEVVEINTSYP